MVLMSCTPESRFREHLLEEGPSSEALDKLFAYDRKALYLFAQSKGIDIGSSPSSVHAPNLSNTPPVTNESFSPAIKFTATANPVTKRPSAIAIPSTPGILLESVVSPRKLKKSRPGSPIVTQGSPVIQPIFTPNYTGEPDSLAVPSTGSVKSRSRSRLSVGSNTSARVSSDLERPEKQLSLPGTSSRTVQGHNTRSDYFGSVDETSKDLKDGSSSPMVVRAGRRSPRTSGHTTSYSMNAGAWVNILSNKLGLVARKKSRDNSGSESSFSNESNDSFNGSDDRKRSFEVINRKVRPLVSDDESNPPTKDVILVPNLSQIPEHGDPKMQGLEDATEDNTSTINIVLNTTVSKSHDEISRTHYQESSSQSDTGVSDVEERRK